MATGARRRRKITRDIPRFERAPAGAPEWGSDVIAEMLRRLRVPYLALMPGASLRGLQDSVVNYLGNDAPQLILTNHEEVAVAIAHGYAKYSGRAMAAAVHSTVGLMHATMTIFCAWCDREPVLILGGTGPMDAAARRPWIDWIHTARSQGELVRDFTKWEDQPSSIAAMPESVLRAWLLAHQQPRGPVYVCLDAGLQEQRVASPLALPDVAAFAMPTAPAPDSDAVRAAARLLVGAAYPLLLLGRTSASEAAWADVIALAESLGAAVVTDRLGPTSFPTDHLLHQGAWRSASHDAAAAAIRDADVILAVNRVDVAGALSVRRGSPIRLVIVSLDSYATRSWSADYQALPEAEMTITADADLAVAALRHEVARLLRDTPSAARAAADRTSVLAASSRRQRAAELAADEAHRDDVPIHLTRALSELHTALGPRAIEAIVAQQPHGAWPTATWPFRRPRAHLGHDGGAAVGSGTGIAVGAGLGAYGSGRPVVAVIGDGELLAAPSALWTAAHHGIPVLFVIANNQSYYNDEEHQAAVAATRERPRENKWIGQRMDEPEIDFAGLARDLGIEGIGPVKEPSVLTSAMRRGVAAIDDGRPALIDVRIAST
jgi:thiamine pyrophosphate-dependent acetolactate synthase large subunit-like protein